MSSSYVTPAIRDPDRRFFDRARRRGNALQAHNARLDQFTYTLQQKAEASDGLPNFSAEITMMKAKTARTLEKHQFDGNATWGDYYRLLGHNTFLSELVYAPLLFRKNSNPEIRNVREQMTNGIYGVSVSILEHALEQYDHPDTTREEKEDLKGAINEHTAIALLNLAQDPDHITLPAPIGKDMREQTDLIRHSIDPETGTYQTLPIQVKSHPPSSLVDGMTPDKGILVTAQMMGNGEYNGFVTARAIVAQVMNANITKEKAVQYDEHLRYFHAHFMQEVANHTRTVSAGHEVAKIQQTHQEIGRQALKAA